jgi:hypothetical protein
MENIGFLMWILGCIATPFIVFLFIQIYDYVKNIKVSVIK